MCPSSSHVHVVLTIVEVEDLNFGCLGCELEVRTIKADVLDSLLKSMSAKGRLFTAQRRASFIRGRVSDSGERLSLVPWLSNADAFGWFDC